MIPYIPMIPYSSTLAFTAAAAANPQASQQGCRVLWKGRQVELCSPLFVFRLDTAAGPRAMSWENRLTGNVLDLGEGPELETDIGLPDRLLKTPPFAVASADTKCEGEQGEVAFTLRLHFKNYQPFRRKEVRSSFSRTLLKGERVSCCSITRAEPSTIGLSSPNWPEKFTIRKHAQPARSAATVHREHHAARIRSCRQDCAISRPTTSFISA